MYLKVYIDIFGRIGLCEKYPDTEEYQGMNEMLQELAEFENFHGDLYPEHKQGFYMGRFEISNDGDEDYLQIEEVKPIE